MLCDIPSSLLSRSTPHSVSKLCSRATPQRQVQAFMKCCVHTSSHILITGRVFQEEQFSRIFQISSDNRLVPVDWQKSTVEICSVHYLPSSTSGKIVQNLLEASFEFPLTGRARTWTLRPSAPGHRLKIVYAIICRDLYSKRSETLRTNKNPQPFWVLIQEG